MTLSEAAIDRLSVASRIVAAIAGGYLLSSLFVAVVSLLLPVLLKVAAADAVIFATISSFLIYAIAIICVFHARSAWRAWIGLAVTVVPLAMALYVLLPGGQG